MIGSKRKSEDVHASTGERTRSERRACQNWRRRRRQNSTTNIKCSFEHEGECCCYYRNEERKESDDKSGETKKEQTIDGLFQRVAVVDGFGSATNDFQTERFSHIYNNGGEIPQVLSNNINCLPRRKRSRRHL